jgi:hypothetical protein
VPVYIIGIWSLSCFLGSRLTTPASFPSGAPDRALSAQRQKRRMWPSRTHGLATTSFKPIRYLKEVQPLCLRFNLFPSLSLFRTQLLKVSDEMSTLESDSGPGAPVDLPSDDFMRPYVRMAYSVLHLSMLTLGTSVLLCKSPLLTMILDVAIQEFKFAFAFTVS